MTNGEIRMTKEVRMFKVRNRFFARSFDHLSFVIHSSFELRHLDL
jgi:hypothetical protein